MPLNSMGTQGCHHLRCEAARVVCGVESPQAPEAFATNLMPSGGHDGTRDTNRLRIR
jgi:hypothetical protein